MRHNISTMVVHLVTGQLSRQDLAVQQSSIWATGTAPAIEVSRGFPLLSVWSRKASAAILAQDPGGRNAWKKERSVPGITVYGRIGPFWSDAGGDGAWPRISM